MWWVRIRIRGVPDTRRRHSSLNGRKSVLKQSTVVIFLYRISSPVPSSPIFACLLTRPETFSKFPDSVLLALPLLWRGRMAIVVRSQTNSLHRIVEKNGRLTCKRKHFVSWESYDEIPEILNLTRDYLHLDWFGSKPERLAVTLVAKYINNDIESRML